MSVGRLEVRARRKHCQARMLIREKGIACSWGRGVTGAEFGLTATSYIAHSELPPRNLLLFLSASSISLVKVHRKP